MRKLSWITQVDLVQSSETNIGAWGQENQAQTGEKRAEAEGGVMCF